MTPRNMTPEESYRYYYAEGEFALAQLYKELCEQMDQVDWYEEEFNNPSKNKTSDYYALKYELNKLRISD